VASDLPLGCLQGGKVPQRLSAPGLAAPLGIAWTPAVFHGEFGEFFFLVGVGGVG